MRISQPPRPRRHAPSRPAANHRCAPPAEPPRRHLSPIGTAHRSLTRDAPQTVFSTDTEGPVEGCLGNSASLPRPQDTPPLGSRHQSAPCTAPLSRRLARNWPSPLPAGTRLRVALVTTTAGFCFRLAHSMAPARQRPTPLGCPALLPSLRFPGRPGSHFFTTPSISESPWILTVLPQSFPKPLAGHGAHAFTPSIRAADL